MKSINVKKVIMIGAFSIMLDAGTGTLHSMNNTDSSVEQDFYEHITLKEIEALERELYNSGFKPELPVRGAALKVMETLKSMVSCDKNFIDEQIKLILDPIRMFFDDVDKTRQIKEDIRSTAERSLLSKTASTEELRSERSMFFILKFIDSEEALDVFFNKNINTKEDLVKFCIECDVFFKDLEESLSKFFRTTPEIEEEQAAAAKAA